VIKIKACPFCKGKHVYTEIADNGNCGSVACATCGSTGPDVDTRYNEDSDAPWRKEAITEWNDGPNK